MEVKVVLNFRVNMRGWDFEMGRLDVLDRGMAEVVGGVRGNMAITSWCLKRGKGSI